MCEICKNLLVRLSVKALSMVMTALTARIDLDVEHDDKSGQGK